MMQAFQGFFDHFHVGWLTKVVGVLLVTAALGGMLAWLAGPSRGLLMVAGRRATSRPSSRSSTSTACSRTSWSPRASSPR
ncbi:hypothetical protein GCM10020221_29710 [Streptomyces thioluteus]|uniref:Uncharacterized protein n=1 Tax=Streptomyces thioluteus TaxID=66431 RepID=A0ABP6JFW5_STRTU